jgi:uncharacterized protein YciW
LYGDLLFRLWKALAHVRVIIHKPKVRLEEVNAVGVLRALGWSARG